MSKKTPDNKPAVNSEVSFVSNMKKSYVEVVVPSMISRFSYDNALRCNCICNGIFYSIVVSLYD